MKAVETLWRAAGLPDEALAHLELTGAEPALASSFAIGTAAQASLACAALAAAELGRRRNGLSQSVGVDMRHAALECSARFLIDGRAPELWDKIAGLYACGPDGGEGWVRLHTNFAHHRDGTLRLLGLPQGPLTTREQVASALRGWRAMEFEEAAANAGLVVAALRSFAEWDAHPQSAAVATRPLVDIERIGEAAPLRWSELGAAARPLAGLRVLDLTRILAGPVGGRTLAAYGADVMLVNAPHLPNIEAIADTSRGKLSTLVDLREPSGREQLSRLVDAAHVVVQGYRPGAIASLGFGAHDLAAARPGIVAVSLSAYGDSGPWSIRRGFDSLVQTATGFNDAEGRAAASAQPRALPVQLLDMATGFLIAFGAEVALMRQREEGGSWHVRVSLARTAQWVRQLGRIDRGFDAIAPDFSDVMESQPSGWGELTAVKHAARFSRTPAGFARASMPPGSHPPVWPDGRS